MFIVLEGIDGCGKTTQSMRLEAFLASKGRRVVRTFEPGGWSGGGMIREMLMHGDISHELTQFFLFTADRCEHAASVIEPALASGADVICDRYVPSTVAYQLSSSRIDGAVRARLAALPYEIGMPRPDLVIWLDIDVGSAQSRTRSRGKMSAFDRAGDEAFERIRRNYEEQYEARGDARWARIDASPSEDAVFDAIAREMELCL